MNAKAAKAALSLAEAAVSLARAIQADANAVWRPPQEVAPSAKEGVVPSVLFKKAHRNYLVMVVHQINTAYASACYDACAVMVRRLVESLIIEAFEANGLDANIKDPAGDFKSLSVLIDRAVAEPSWNLSRNAKQALKKLKTVGDVSAHNRRYVATRHDIEDLIGDIRVIAQEFLALAKLR